MRERQASSSEQARTQVQSAKALSEQLDQNSPLVRFLGMRRNNILKAEVVAHAPLLQPLEVRLTEDAIHEPFAAHLNVLLKLPIRHCAERLPSEGAVWSWRELATRVHS